MSSPVAGALNRLQPLPLSLLLHGAAVVFLALVLLYDRRPKQVVDFEVIEAPVQALNPIRASAPAKPREEPRKKPRQVFGASRKSVMSEEGLETKQGNTVAKAPDNEKLRADDADALPIPAEEYLVTKMPEIAEEIRVPYPEEARKKGVQGPVLFDLLIDSQGRVREAKFLEGPGAGLNEAAQEAVMRLKFKPAYVENNPVAVRIRYAYRFVLERR